ncbi:acyltransferase [Sphingomonas oligophenolica]|uniref:Acyltransferase n=1 Tax=Sphingomonas oligophenolica TaxID=301154 RepID=A0ABU9Y893_9SPHN
MISVAAAKASAIPDLKPSGAITGSMANSKPRAIIAIDLLRFACALLVLANHFGGAFARAPSASARYMLSGLHASDAAISWSWFGWIGVELFFVISGFVIALSAEGSSWSGFLRRRALRLVPAAWICATATFLILAVAAPSTTLPAKWGATLAFWPVGPWIDASCWTLGIEICFYLLIATGLGRTGRAAMIERYAVWLGAVSAAGWLFAALSGWVGTPRMDDRMLQLSLLPHGCLFALGVLASAMTRRGVTGARAGPFALFLLPACAEIASRTIERTQTFGVSAGPLVPTLLFLAGLAMVLGSGRMQPFLSRRIDARLAATLGLMTYPLYLIHQEAGAALIATLMRAGMPYWPASGVALLAVLVFAWWVAHAAEPVVRARLASLMDAVSARRGRAPDTPPSPSPRAG